MLNFILLSIIFAAQAYGLRRTFILISEREWSWFPVTALGFIRIGSWASWAAAATMLTGIFLAKAGDAPGLMDGYVSYFVGWAILITIGVAIWGWFTSRGEETDENHLRGAKLVDPSVVIKRIKKQKLDWRLTVGGVPIPRSLENRGVLTAGSPGTGKSQVISVIGDQVREDGDRAVLADASGIYYSRWAAEGDVLLNPFDARSAAWSPLAEIKSIADCPALAKSMVPDGNGSAAEWNGYAQSVLQPLLEHCWEDGRTNADLFQLACITPAEDLRQVLAGTPAAPLIAEGNERMFGSVRAILASYLKAYQYLQPDAGADGFSIRDYIENGSGWLFITYRQDQRDALRPLIQAQLDVASRATLSLPPSHDRRIFYFLDEFPLLGQIQSVESLLTNGRKHGAVPIIGIQTVAQMTDVYGREKSQILLACLGTWLTLRVSDAETAEYMSRYIGDEEIRRVVKSGGTSSKSLEAASKSENWQEQITKQRAVLPSELQNLPDLAGYLNIAGDLPLCPVQLPLAEQRRDEATAAFVPAPPRQRVKPIQASVPAAPEAAEIGATDLPFTL